VTAIAITGATGFLGGALARKLLGTGQPVIAMGRNETKLAALEQLGATCIAGDLSRGAPPAPGTDVSAVVHCAALSSAWGAYAGFRAANVYATSSALAFARISGARRFVHISTPSLYFRLCDQRLVREDMALPQPVNAYAATKREAESLVRTQTDLDYLILRPRGLYGPGDTALLPRLLRAARTGPLPLVRSGSAETDLTHIDDVVDSVLAALRAPAGLPKRVFNISGGEPKSIRTITEAACARAGVAVRWRSMPSRVLLVAARAMEVASHMQSQRPEPRITAYGAGLFAFTQTLDISAAKAHLGWSPAVSFEEGLRRTFEVQA
jgi:nucleoside-diphosphate-sugar epimerase